MVASDIANCLSKEELAWYRVIKDYVASGLSQQKYCTATGVDRKNLMKWCRKLTKKEGDVVKKRYVDRIAIAPVKLKDAPPARSYSIIRLELPNKLNVHIPADFDPGTLKKILEVVS